MCFFLFLFSWYLPLWYTIIQQQTNRCEKLKKKTNSQACCYIIFNVPVLHIYHTIHHFENSVIYINIEIHCIFNVMFFPSFSFLLGTCLNENNDKRSWTKKLERMPFIRLSTEHVRTFQQWKYDTETFKFCSTISFFLKVSMVKVLNFKIYL